MKYSLLLFFLLGIPSLHGMNRVTKNDESQATSSNSATKEQNESQEHLRRAYLFVTPRIIETEQSAFDESLVVDGKNLKELFKRLCDLEIFLEKLSTPVDQAAKWHELIGQTKVLKNRLEVFLGSMNTMGVALGESYNLMVQSNCSSESFSILTSTLAERLYEHMQIEEHIQRIEPSSFFFFLKNPEGLFDVIPQITSEARALLRELIEAFAKRQLLRQKMTTSARPYVMAIRSYIDLIDKVHVSNEKEAREMYNEFKHRSALPDISLNAWYGSNFGLRFTVQEKEMRTSYFKMLISVEYAQESSREKLNQELREVQEELGKARCHFEDKGPLEARQLDEVNREIERIRVRCAGNKEATELMSFFDILSTLGEYQGLVKALSEKLRRAALGLAIPLEVQDGARLETYMKPFIARILHFSV